MHPEQSMPIAVQRAARILKSITTSVFGWTVLSLLLLMVLWYDDPTPFFLEGPPVDDPRH